MTLLAVQRGMRGWLIQEDADAPARFGAASAAGLRVYQNNYRTRLVDCLEASFAATRAWIGDEAFLRAAATHIDLIPPSSWTLDAYARDFPASLSTLYKDDPEVAEIAALELAVEDVFVGADAATVTVADMAGIDWNRATLALVPALDLVPVRTNAVEIWSALAGAEPPPAMCEIDDGAALVWRQEQRSRVRMVDAFEMQALIRARAGVAFANLCDSVVRAFGEDDAPAVAGGWLGRWVGDGLIREIVETD